MLYLRRRFASRCTAVARPVMRALQRVGLRHVGRRLAHHRLAALKLLLEPGSSAPRACFLESPMLVGFVPVRTQSVIRSACGADAVLSHTVVMLTNSRRPKAGRARGRTRTASRGRMAALQLRCRQGEERDCIYCIAGAAQSERQTIRRAYVVRQRAGAVADTGCDAESMWAARAPRTPLSS